MFAQSLAKSLAVAALVATTTSACSVYTSTLQREHVVETVRLAPQNVTQNERPATDGVTVLRRDGAVVVFPAGSQVTKLRDGIAVDPGLGRPVESFATDEVVAVELRHGSDRDVRRRVRDASASNALTVVGVIVGTVVVVGAGMAIATSSNSFGGMDIGRLISF